MELVNRGRSGHGTPLTVFVITVVIGLVKGQWSVTLGRPVVLTHVHTIALAHTEFVGMMVNTLFATLSLATLARRTTVWPGADHVQFWGINVVWLRQPRGGARPRGSRVRQGAG